MDLKAFVKYVVYGIVKFLASTRIIELLLKIFDTICRTLEQVGKYSVQEASKADNVENEKLGMVTDMKRPLPLLIFWVVLVDLHLFRVVFSMISVIANKKPIDIEDIVRSLRKIRRRCHSFRCSRSQKQRDQQVEIKVGNGENANVSASNKKRDHVNGTDDSNSAYAEEKSFDTSSSSFPNDEPCKSPTLPNQSSEHELPNLNVSGTSSDITFESTLGDTSTASGSSHVGKTALNLYSDPANALMTKLVTLKKRSKPYSKPNNGKNHSAKQTSIRSSIPVFHSRKMKSPSKSP